MNIRKYLRFTAYCLKQSVLHPRAIIVYCCDNPGKIKMKPITWQGCIIAFLLGAGLFIISCKLDITELKYPAQMMMDGAVFTIFGVNVGMRQVRIE